MDHALLEAVSRELAAARLGHPVADLIQLESHRFLLRFDGAPFPRVHIGIHPRLSTVHLARGVKAPSNPTELSGAMTLELKGREADRLVFSPFGFLRHSVGSVTRRVASLQCVSRSVVACWSRPSVVR